jgi:carbamoyl-phosphate synthase large subunit
MKKPINVLVFPAGMENGLEIIKSLRGCKEIRLFGGSSADINHSFYTFKKTNILGDVRGIGWIDDLNEVIKKNKIDIIYPANSIVIDHLSSNRNKISAKVLLPSEEIINLTRSKRATLNALKDSIPIPKVFSAIEEIQHLPVFAKPDRGYGSQGASVITSFEEIKKINFKTHIVQENLPGREYTIDCFSDANGGLLFSGARERDRVRMGTSMHAESVSNELEVLMRDYALKILQKIQISGAWFFQVKEDFYGVLKLLEIDVRIAGTMCFHRGKGVNFPLLSIHQFYGETVKTLINDIPLTLDRCLKNRFSFDYDYDVVYLDLDDTLVIHDKLNIELITFLFQCVNQKKKIILISKFLGDDIRAYLKKWRVLELFDDIIWLSEDESKASFLPRDRAIFIDDSFSQRLEVSEICGIPTFDPSMIEVLLDDKI